MPEQEKNVEQLATELKKATDSVKDLGEELKGKMANGEKGLEDLKGMNFQKTMSSKLQVRLVLSA